MAERARCMPRDHEVVGSNLTRDMFSFSSHFDSLPVFTRSPRKVGLWDQKVGPKSGTNRHFDLYISLSFSHLCEQPLWPSWQDTRLRSERKSDRISLLTLLFFSCHILAVHKNARLDFREEIPRLSYPFLHKQATNFRVVGFAWGEMTIIHA